MPFPNAYAKAQRREAIRVSKRQWFFAPLRLGVIFFLLSFSVATNAQTNTLSDAKIQGRQLAHQLCDAWPAGNLTNAGTFNIRSNGQYYSYQIKCLTLVAATNWLSVFEMYDSTNSSRGKRLIILHAPFKPNEYKLTFFIDGNKQLTKDGQEVIKQLPFVGDFGCADLGLEFFHWPVQKVLPKTTTLKRGREYTLLESTNPTPPTNGYSRVLSWIDKESCGILAAEAYDAKGKLLKEFEPKSFKKVNGQWELQEMEIRNVQTGSRTRLEFDLRS